MFMSHITVKSVTLARSCEVISWKYATNVLVCVLSFYRDMKIVCSAKHTVLSSLL
jgi:hypothetical protein